MPFQTGDRVRIKNPQSEYTGCRGTVSDQPGSDSVSTLGHLVAIDGENGMTRPFLVGDLVPLRAARVSGVRNAQTADLSAGRPGSKSGSR
ncbi:MAG: hypothetical protein AB8G23_16385 [Myxococcota bacterium]